MAIIKTKAGLNIPLKGEPRLELSDLPPTDFIGIDLSSCAQTKLKLLVKEGETVEIGTPVAQDKKIEERLFVSYACGTVHQIIRGEKRKPLYIVIKRDAKDQSIKLEPIHLGRTSRRAILERMCHGGAFTRIRKRPGYLLANPRQLPRSIFIQGLESAPFHPDCEWQVKGVEKALSKGLKALEMLVCGNVHMVVGADSRLTDYTDDVGVHSHTAAGNHPIANPSIHIEQIDPITGIDDVIWTLHISDVIYIGALLMGKIYNRRVISICGEGLKPEMRKYYRVSLGSDVAELIHGRLLNGEDEILSGGPLMGSPISQSPYLGSDHFSISAIRAPEQREALHFFRLGAKKYTASRTYLSAFLKKYFSVSTLQHGEKRPFIDGRIYDKVMPLQIPTMPLIKALECGDYEQAVDLGLLEVAPEDFALCSFVCPSKIDHVGIVSRGLLAYAEQYLE